MTRMIGRDISIEERRHRKRLARRPATICVLEFTPPLCHDNRVREHSLRSRHGGENRLGGWRVGTRVTIHGSIILGIGLMDVEILPRGVVFEALGVTVVPFVALEDADGFEDLVCKGLAVVGGFEGGACGEGLAGLDAAVEFLQAGS